MFEQEFIHAKRENIPFSLMIQDVDYFKKHNAEYECLNGDRTLANELYKKIEQAFISNNPVSNNSGEALPATTVSTGLLAIGKTKRKKVERLSELITAFDEALYRAKKHGRNYVSG